MNYITILKKEFGSIDLVLDVDRMIRDRLGEYYTERKRLFFLKDYYLDRLEEVKTEKNKLMSYSISPEHRERMNHKINLLTLYLKLINSHINEN